MNENLEIKHREDGEEDDEDEIIDIGDDIQPFSMKFNPQFVTKKPIQSQKEDKRYIAIDEEITEFDINNFSEDNSNLQQQSNLTDKQVQFYERQPEINNQIDIGYVEPDFTKFNLRNYKNKDKQNQESHHQNWENINMRKGITIEKQLQQNLKIEKKVYLA